MGTEGGSFKKFKKHIGLSRFLFCYFILFYPFCFTPFTLLSVFQIHRGVYRPVISYCAMYSNFSPPHISAWAAPATLLVISHHNFENCRDIAFKTLDHTKFLRSYDTT